MKIEKVSIPKYSILAKKIFDYADSYKAQFKDTYNRVKLVSTGRAFFSSTPKWVDHLFELRNKLVAVFGLKTGKGTQNKAELLKNSNFEAGDKLGLFKVFERTENEIILGEDDKHLDFRVSLFLESITNDTKVLTVSTTVKYNNGFGRVYFFFVKPFHQLIVTRMLKGIIEELGKKG